MRPFFEVPPPPPVQPRDRRPRPWEQPLNVVGQEVPLEVVIARSTTIAVILGDMTAYPNGFAFTVSVRSKPGHPMDSDSLGPGRRRAQQAEGQVDDIFRFDIEFADGSLVTNHDTIGIGSPNRPKPPILIGGGGGGGDRRYDFSFWVWPLPRPGPLTFVTQWQAAGLPSTRFELDGDSIVTAARTAKTIATA